MHTEYVSTRWYRAPELVLRIQNYSEKVDIFALGCIMAELYLGRPIFPGTSESDQLTRIVTVLGTPSRSEWPEGLQHATQKGITFPMIQAQSLKQHFQNSIKTDISDDALDLLSKMFKFNSEERYSAQQCMNHPFFKNVSPILKNLATSQGTNAMNRVKRPRLPITSTPSDTI